MKTNILIKGLIGIAGIFLVNFFIIAQNCNKQSICRPDANDGYDYSSQSRYAVMTTGEKSRLYITTYMNCSYKISVCSEENLGKMNFKLYEKVREKKKIFKELVKGEAPVITDAKGNQSFGEAPVIDTLYDVEVSLKEIEIFDSSKNGSNVWQINNVNKTKNIVLELTIPKTEQVTTGCVNLMVGTKRPVKSHVGKLKDVKG